MHQRTGDRERDSTRIVCRLFVSCRISLRDCVQLQCSSTVFFCPQEQLQIPSLSTSPHKHQTTEAATIGPSLISAAVDVVPLKKLSGGRRSLAGRRWYVDRIYNHLTLPIQTRIPKVNHRGRRYPSYK